MGTVSNEEWTIVKRRCHLNEEELWMAKQMHFTPKRILKMGRDKCEAWKDIVPLRIRRLYDEKFGKRSDMKKKNPNTHVHF